MALDKFRCTTANGDDLCFNGGTCTFFPDDVQKCTCPPGWGPDNTAFHNDNCTLPDYALLAVFITNSVLSIGYLFLLYRVRPKARDKALRILNYANIIVIMLAAQILAIWLENGWFTATSVIVALMVVVFCAWGSELSEIVARPLFGMNRDIQVRVTRSIKTAFILLIVVNVTTTIGLAVTAQLGPIAFNKAMIVYSFLMFLSAMLFSAILVHYGNQLRRTIQDHDLESKADLDEKLKKMMSGALSVLIGQLPSICTCIIVLILGSSPWYWVIVVVVFLSTPLSVVGPTLAIFKDLGGSSSGGMNRSKSKDMLDPQQSFALSSKVVVDG